MAYLDDQGVDPYELADSQQIHNALGSDTTAIQYLNIRPADIKQQVDEQNLAEATDVGS